MMQGKKVRRTIIFVIAGFILLLAATVWFSISTIGRVNSNLEIQVQTRTVIIALKDNLSNMLNIETDERGFLLTGDPIFLVSLDSSLVQINSNISELRSLLHKNFNQQKNIALLQDLVYAKVSSTKKLINAKKIQVSGLNDLIEFEKNRFLLDQIRTLNNTIQKQEEKLFVERKTNTSISIRRAYIVFIVEGFLAISITLFLAFMIINELNRRTRIEYKLNQSNRDLKRKNKEIEQFAYVASHDLQEPLRSISNFSRLLSMKLKDHPDKDVRDYIGFVSGAAGRMSSLIFDLLEYSRIGRETQRLKIDTNLIVKEILTDLSVALKEKNIEMHVQNLPVIDGYPYIKSLFLNLISNAIKFTRIDVIPVVDIFANESEEEFIFTVKDNGIGIEQVYHDKIFIIFQRLHTRDEFPGTGIGLALSKKIVDLHGGNIYVDSEPGKGSSFIFTIPKI
jgi:signal transduction histidine kinase